MKRVLLMTLMVVLIISAGGMIFYGVINRINPGYAESIICEKLYGNTQIPQQLFNDYYDIYNYYLLRNTSSGKKDRFYRKIDKESRRVEKFSKEYMDKVCIYKKEWSDIEANPGLNSLVKCGKLSELKKQIERFYKTREK